MKKILIFLGVIIIAFAALACDPDDENKGEPPRNYVGITYDEFLSKTSALKDIANYIGAGRADGYAVDFESKVGSVTCDFDAEIDIRDAKNVKMEAEAVFGGLKSETGSGSKRAVELLGPNQLRADIYMRDGTLYLETLRNNITEHDSLTLNNSLNALATCGIGLGDIFDLVPYDLPPVELLSLADDLDEFEDKMKIDYCEEAGHIVFELDYDVFSNVQRFKLDIEMYIRADRITELEYDFTSADCTFSLSIEEEREDIEFPNLPEFYTGTLLDELDDFVQNQDIVYDDFFGVWTGSYNGAISYELTVSDGALRLVSDAETVEFDEYVLYFNRLSAYGKFGEGEGLYEFKLRRSDDTILLTLPDTAQVVLSRK